MNKQRKKEIQSYAVSLDMIYKRLNKILEDEQYYYENIPENLQASRRADDSEIAIDTLSEQLDILSEIISELRSI